MALLVRAATMSLVCISAIGLESINLERNKPGKLSRAQPWRNLRKSHTGACVCECGVCVSACAHKLLPRL